MYVSICMQGGSLKPTSHTAHAGAHPAVARGHLVEIGSHSLTLAVDKPLRPGLRQGAAGSEHAPALLPADAAATHAAPVWRLDRDDVGGTFVRQRGFLYDVFRAECAVVRDQAPGAGCADAEAAAEESVRASLRRLVVGLEPPRSTPTQGLDVGLPFLDPALRDSLNEGQRRAVARACDPGVEYSLVLGAPGAGKTSAIVGTVLGLVALGQSVLISSYTNRHVFD